MHAPTPAVARQVELLEAIAVIAVEHENELDLTTLVSFVDLYARALQHAGDGADVVEFERFVSDGTALERAAMLAERETGVPTRCPAPLGRVA